MSRPVPHSRTGRIRQTADEDETPATPDPPARRGPLKFPAFRQFEPWESFLAVLLVGWLVFLFWRCITAYPALDTGLAYNGGQLAWATGHPERLPSWISSPFLALIMGLASRVLTRNQAGVAVTYINYVLVVALLPAIWLPLRRRVSRLFWWLTLTGAVVFAPLASTLFWRQFNLISLAFALAAFWLSARRPVAAGALAALSLAVKPIILLLPLALLWKRETRRAGIWTLVWGIAVLFVSQLFLAWRAHSLRVLVSLAALRNFENKSLPGNGWVCNRENFSPESTMCRVIGLGGADWSVTRDLTLLGVAGIIFIAALLLRRTAGSSWLVFAFVCLLSPMVSPIAWSHYQILMAPMFLLLAYELYHRKGGVVEWALLGASYGLCELTWRPYGMISNILQRLIRGTPGIASRYGNNSLSPHVYVLFGFAQFAQYVLFFAALVWFSRFGDRPSPKGTTESEDTARSGLTSDDVCSPSS
jgi:hypothetical protein